MSRDFWANFSSETSGNGTEASPFTYNQICNYFNPDIGDKCDIVPIDGDIINAEGIINLIGEDTVFNIKRNLSGKVIIKVKDLLVLPWRIELSDNFNNNVYLFQNVSGYAINDIELRDFVVCRQVNDGMPTDTNIIINNVIMDSVVNMEFRNFIVSTDGNIKLSASENIDVKCYGYSFVANIFTLSINGYAVLSNITMYDGVIKANQIVEEGASTTTSTTTTTTTTTPAPI